MRLGGGVLKEFNNLDEWLEIVKELEYSAVICPFTHVASNEKKEYFTEIIKANNLVLGEVGVWKNTLSYDDKERKSAIEYAINQLKMADELGANCCVNIVGARGEKWDGVYRENYSKDTYALIVDMIREIIDAIKPKNTFYTIEPMPWMVPSSPEEYLRLIKDVDRKEFAVHLDYTNMINNPKRYVDSLEFIKKCFDLLGPYIKSIHAKDAYISQDVIPCYIKEVMPGQGSFDYVSILKYCESLGEDTTVFVEHLNSHEEYKEACSYIRRNADEAGVFIK